MLRNTMSGQSHQNIAEMIKLLESTSISVTEPTCALVRDSLSSSSDPSLLNGLVDHYITSGNTVIRTLIIGVRSPQYKNFLIKLDEHLQKPATRYAALNLMGHVVRKEPLWLHHIVQSRAFTNVIKCLQLENDIAVLTMAMYVMSTLLPKVPTQITPSLNHLFGIFIRLVSWKIIRGVDAGEISLFNFETALFSFFLTIYGMYPCNLIEYLQNYYGKKKSSDTSTKQHGVPSMKYASSPGEEQVLMEKKRHEIFRVSVAPMLRKVRLSPSMIMYSKDLEVTSEKWRKMESHDIVTDISQQYIAEDDIICKDISDQSPVQSSKPLDDIFVDQIAAENNVSDEAVWSPSMVIGLSTPPSSRGISPTKEVLDDAKSNSERSRMKIRPAALSLSHGPVRTPNASTPCTPTLADRLFEFGKVDSDGELTTSTQSSALLTPKDAGTDSSSLTGPGKFHFSTVEMESSSKNENFIPDFSPALQPIKDDSSIAREKGKEAKVLDSLFIETEKPSVQNLIELAHGDLTDGKKSAILENELRMSIQAGKKKSDIDWQHFGQGPLSEKEAKCLLSGYLQLQCALVFEKHHRMQHATRARRLMRKIYEASALAERNTTLEEILSDKDAEISKLQALVKSLRADKLEVETKHRSSTEILKHELSRNSVILKTTKEENERLEREKSQDKEKISVLIEEKKRLNTDLNKAKLQLEYETRNKETSQELQAQVIKLQKDLLLAEELNGKVQILRQNDDHFKVAKVAEYEMMIQSYQKENSTLKEKYLKASRAQDIATVKVADVTRILEKKNSLLEEQKKYLENVKSLARSQIQAIQNKYQSQKSIITQMEIQIMELYAKLLALGGSNENDSHTSLSAGRLIQKSSHMLQTDSGSVTGASPELSPPGQIGLSGQSTVGTSELEATTLSDQ